MPRGSSACPIYVIGNCSPRSSEEKDSQALPKLSGKKVMWLISHVCSGKKNGMGNRSSHCYSEHKRLGLQGAEGFLWERT